MSSQVFTSISGTKMAALISRALQLAFLCPRCNEYRLGLTFAPIWAAVSPVGPTSIRSI